ECLVEKLHHFHTHHVDVAVRRELQVVAKIEPSPANDGYAAEARIIGALAHNVADALVPPEDRDLIDEMAEQAVEIEIRACFRWKLRTAVTEGSAVSEEGIPQRVAKHVATIELVQAKRAITTRKPDGSRVEEFLELSNNAEDADLLMLIDVIEVADRREQL